eukprot:8543990-Prorocentrum_lima.AAC.1
MSQITPVFRFGCPDTSAEEWFHLCTGAWRDMHQPMFPWSQEPHPVERYRQHRASDGRPRA